MNIAMQGERAIAWRVGQQSRMETYRNARWMFHHGFFSALRIALSGPRIETVTSVAWAPDTRSSGRRELERKAWYALDCPPVHDPATDLAVKTLADKMEGQK